MINRPDKATLNRIYWLEEWSLATIAELYGVSHQAVWGWLKHDGIPTRKRGHNKKSHESICMVKGCKKAVAKVLRQRKDGRTWYYTIRCAAHHHEYVKEKNRDYNRRRNGITKFKPLFSKKAAGSIVGIASPDMGYYGPTRGVWVKRKSGKYGPLVKQFIQTSTLGFKK